LGDKATGYLKRFLEAAAIFALAIFLIKLAICWLISIWWILLILAVLVIAGVIGWKLWKRRHI